MISARTEPGGCGNPQRCVCGRDMENSVPVLRVRASISIRRCRACGQAFTYPPPYAAVEECDAYKRAGEVHSDPRRAEEFIGYARLILSVLDGGDSLRGKRLLDVGCGGGELLIEGRRRGMDVCGVEINPHQRAHLTGEGYAVVPEIADLPGRDFDIVALSHVLEHVPSPDAFLKSLASRMKDGSVLLVSVPNFDSFLAKTLGRHWVGLQVTQHLWQFTPPTLVALLSRCGFRTRRLETPALGKGMDAGGRIVHADATFLLDSQGRLAVILASLGLRLIDRLLGGIAGRWIRRQGEKRGGDNMILVAAPDIEST